METIPAFLKVLRTQKLTRIGQSESVLECFGEIEIVPSATPRHSEKMLQCDGFRRLLEPMIRHLEVPLTIAVSGSPRADNAKNPIVPSEGAIIA